MLTKIDAMETAAGGAGEISDLRTYTPAVLRWARERADLDIPTLADKMGVQPEAVEVWEQSGELQLKLADKLADVTLTHAYKLNSDTPPQDKLSIPDLRVPVGAPPRRPSPCLQEIAHEMQCRQDFLVPELVEREYWPRLFVADPELRDASPQQVAAALRNALGLAVDWVAEQGSWEASLKRLRNSVEAAEVLIFCYDIAGHDQRFRLNPNEFSGLALIDERRLRIAPLIFINSAGHRAARLFAVAHELAHLCINEPGVSVLNKLLPAQNEVEQRCDAIAAEFLLPESLLRGFLETTDGEIAAGGAATGSPVEIRDAIAHRFKVGPLVAARRALDLGLVELAEYLELYDQYEASQPRGEHPEKISDEEFWRKQRDYIGHWFGSLMLDSERCGRILWHDAVRMTGIRRGNYDILKEKIASGEWT